MQVGVQAKLDCVVDQMSQWEPDSTLSRINTSAPEQWHDLPPEFTHVLEASLSIADVSGGAFDPCIGRLTDLWGFGPPGPVDAIPDAGRITQGDAPPRSAQFDKAQRRVRLAPGAALDFSGIAKGYGVDLASEWLLGEGVRHFLMEVGGELRGEGIRPDGQPWWVEVEMPPLHNAPPAKIALHDLSVATSGYYRRGFTVDNKHYSHSLDPHTGYPVVNGVRSVTVLHRECMMADGWATALTILGPERGIAVADEQGFAACIIAGQREYLSREWQAMLG